MPVFCYRPSRRGAGGFCVGLRGNVKEIEPITLSAPDDEAFSHLVRRIIDVLNAERFPGYGPDVTMLPEERAWFSFRRL